MQTINPTSGEILKTYETISNQEIDRIIEKSHIAFLKWSQESFADRAKILKNIQQNLLKNKQDYAKIITLEMGKPIKYAIAEIEKCALVCEFYANNAEKLLADRSIKTQENKTSHAKSYVCYQPSGTIFAVMPWNFPFWQVFRFAAPNLMAGHACLLKHAEITTGTALAIENCLRESGLPENLFRALLIKHEQSEQVIGNKYVTGVTLTGSEAAGKSIAATAGKYLKKCVMELGGSDPYVILADADLPKAATACLNSRLLNSGQVCIAAKRLIIVESVYEKFKQQILAGVNNFALGDPLNENTILGPLARADLRDTVDKQVTQAINEGATLLMRSETPKSTGFYYPITILENVAAGNIAFDEEIFGPVVALIKAKDEADAIKLANQTRFGLGAAVFTQDLKRGEEIARAELNAGSVAVNTFVASNPALPFGGIKASGFGRELALEGLCEFMNIKTAVIF